MKKILFCFIIIFWFLRYDRFIECWLNFTYIHLAFIDLFHFRDFASKSTLSFRNDRLRLFYRLWWLFLFFDLSLLFLSLYFYLLLYNHFNRLFDDLLNNHLNVLLDYYLFWILICLINYSLCFLRFQLYLCLKLL